MPELPEVETVVRSLRPRLVGFTFQNVDLLRPDIVKTTGINLPALLRGQTVSAVHRRGKKILIRLASGQTLGIHLGMTGQLTLDPPDAPVKPHTHLIVSLNSPPHPSSSPPSSLRRSVASSLPPQLRFRDVRRFGELWWMENHSDDDDQLGPEPLTLTPQRLARLLTGTTRAIKTALLDQRLIAGIGNIYADESLFLAGLHPLIPANRLSLEQVRRLNRAIKRTLRTAIANHGSSLRDYIDVNGESGRFQNLHRVYAREDQPCCRCRTAIVRVVIGGRSSHFCPRCQPPRS